MLTHLVSVIVVSLPPYSPVDKIAHPPAFDNMIDLELKITDIAFRI